MEQTSSPLPASRYQAIRNPRSSERTPQNPGKEACSAWHRPHLDPQLCSCYRAWRSPQQTHLRALRAGQGRASQLSPAVPIPRGPPRALGPRDCASGWRLAGWLPLRSRSGSFPASPSWIAQGWGARRGGREGGKREGGALRPASQDPPLEAARRERAERGAGPGTPSGLGGRAETAGEESESSERVRGRSGESPGVLGPSRSASKAAGSAGCTVPAWRFP